MKIALIVPRHRIASWHERLVNVLAQTHTVTIFTDDTVTAYPSALRAWIATERLIYGEPRSPRLFDPDRAAQPIHQLVDKAFDRVIDLSERPEPRSGTLSVFYNGSPDSLALIDRLLDRKTPHLSILRRGSCEALGQSMPAIDDKVRLTRGLQLSRGRCIVLLERALRADRTESMMEFPRGDPSWRGSLPAFIGRFLASKAAALLLNGVFPANQWYTALLNASSFSICASRGGRRNFADPFLHSSQGRTFLFVEDWSHPKGKGVISAVEVLGGKFVGAPVPVLERPHHLSYPVIIEEAGIVYMLPESAASRSLELYRAVDFPWRWELDSVLMEGIAAADATPIFFQDRWWLFTAVAEHGTTDQDELFIFHSDSLKGPWLPHARNPVKSDCRSARPAGRLVCRNGRLFRPAQDCEDYYGSAVVWNEIITLSATDYCEREIGRLEGSGMPSISGLHTVNRLAGLQVVDVNVGRTFGRRRRALEKSMSRLGRELDHVLSTFLPVQNMDDHCEASRHSATS